MPRTYGVRLNDNGIAVVEEIAKEHKWTVSQTIRELLAESPEFMRRIEARNKSPRSRAPATAGRGR